MKQPISVIMLPTNKASVGTIMLATGTTSYCIKDTLRINQNPEFNEESVQWGGTFYQPQHLYMITDEEIKEPCWVIYKEKELLYIDELDAEFAGIKGDVGSLRISLCKKIVATTNPERYYEVPRQTRPGKEERTIPSIPQSFITAYILAYNTGKPIKQVMLEYEYNGAKIPDTEEYGMKSITKERRLKIADGSYIGTEKEFLPTSEDMKRRLEFVNKNMELALNPDGSVIWSLKEEKMYTRQELKIACSKACAEMPVVITSMQQKDFEEWFDKHY